MRRELLFSNGNLRDWLQARLEKAIEVVRFIPSDRVLSTPEPELVQEILAQSRAESPRLRLEGRYTPGARDVPVDVSYDWGRAISDRTRPAYVPGTRVEMRVPFDGDPALFAQCPSTVTTVFPRGRIEGQELVVWQEAAADALDVEQFKRGLEGELARIRQYLEWVSQECAQFNEELTRRLEEAVRQRREKVLRDRGLEEFLRIPVDRRADASPVFSVPLAPRQQQGVAGAGASISTRPFVPEPAISLEDFAEILEVIRNYRDLCERLPSTCGSLQENVLRDILLVVLNNQFGPAGSEVFSRRGKTDLLLWHEKGAVFIAECKFWAGAKALRRALDQLLGYLVWRDTKSALVLYVKERNVSRLVTEVEEVFSGHPRFKRRARDVAGLPVYVLHHEGDHDREISVAVVMVALAGQQVDGTHLAETEEDRGDGGT